MKKQIEHNAKILAIFAIACTAMVSLVSLATKDTIARQQQKQLLDTLHQVIAEDKANNDLYNDCKLINDQELLGSNQWQTAYVARLDNQPTAVALTTIAPNGYNGNIELIVAINIDGSISGVRVLGHQETPGLGDKIELRKDNWILTFDGRFYHDDNDLTWAVKKDGGVFDQFTGATITPRAVVQAVKNAQIYFAKHKQELISVQASCHGDNDDTA
ncbi:electron transport complex subunit RsxG [Thalassotalea ponticola]|uniref:electron transport complex subunit RsxG n=1 Tax=Thalassotalea ponticola TaxID=1523392 RepID=UPI0025B57CA1|nr:electron transport complex subunit RsxG [Thalassotalea ponticola]MDN3652194.1 electron transport complex subunit RsxG [Thalassotalea ponticola]